jgi:structural maintenance of chromosome 2
VIGGRNKYLINGHNAQLQRVQNLFHSVQLNVNNPHFLIMQGRITKVLNMKPQEILGMIEEAAGTRMFEAKKQQAINTIEKKQKKVEEIKKVRRCGLLMSRLYDWCVLCMKREIFNVVHVFFPDHFYI